jgi:hypothetical protein
MKRGGSPRPQAFACPARPSSNGWRGGGRFHFALDAAAARQQVRNDDRRLASSFGLQESSFGLQELNDGGWAEDDWHPSYRGAPSDSRPWLEGDSSGVLRGTFWLMAMQDEVEPMNALAGVSWIAAPLPLRGAHDKVSSCEDTEWVQEAAGDGGDVT